MGDANITKNIESFIKSIQTNRPSGAKGVFIAKISVSSTMGPGIEIDASTLDT